MSADDFRDLVSEFDHSAETNLEFYRWSPPDFEYGDPVPGTGGYAQFALAPPWSWIEGSAQNTREQIPGGNRERGDKLFWQWTEALDGTPLEQIRTTAQSTHGKADRIFDVDLGQWFEVNKNGDFPRIAKVNSVVCVLVDGDPL